MITYLNSDIFFSPAKVLVNAVNTQGVMGKGIAKKFKDHFPEMFKEYQKHCENKDLTIGKLWLYKTSNKWVLNFPTKSTWRKPSKLEYIEKGLVKFVESYSEKGISSIAFPTLGCGNGELSWDEEVRPLMERYLNKLPIDIYIHIFNPERDKCFPEHNHISDISSWLHSEPQSLSIYECLEFLKYRQVFEEFSELKNGKFFKDIDVDNGIEIIEKNGERVRVEIVDLVSFWSILREYGLITYETIPSSLSDKYDALVEIFSKLPWISKTEATSNYENIKKKENLLALQLIPDSADITSSQKIEEAI